MKKLLTLGALGMLSASTALAQAPTVDGRIMASEKGTTAGKYQSLGRFTRDPNVASFGDWGLVEAFVTNDANFLYVAIQGTPEGNGNALQFFVNVPSRTGKPAGAPLPAAPSPTGDPVSFANFTGTMDFEVDAGVAFRYNGGTPQLELADYTLATPAAQVLGTMDDQGTAATFLAGAATAAFKTTPDGKVTSNTDEGLEVKIAMAAYGITPGQPVQIFVLQNNGDGGYASADFIPQGPIPPLAGGAPNNMGPAPDFTTVTGNQFNTWIVGQGLGLKKVDATALNFTVAPNPVAGNEAEVAFSVNDKAQDARVVVTDLLGREVAVLANGVLPVGQQRFSLKAANLTSGQYLVKLVLGNQVATRKVAVL